MVTVVSLSPAVDKIYFVDDFMPGGLFRVGRAIKSAGGKGVNVARVASVIGADVGTIGFVAGDTGRWIDLELKKLGIKTDFIKISGESRTNINIIDRVKNTETEVLETGPVTSASDLDEFICLLEKTLPTTHVLICSGGLPEGATEDFYRIIIEIANRHGVKTILDSSGFRLSEGIKARPYLIKPNTRELCQLSGRKLENIEQIIEACRHVNHQGVEFVVASMGSQGAVMVSEKITARVVIPRIAIVNTIGSGDSMVGGMAAGISKGMEPLDFLKLGTACAIVNTLFEEVGYIEKDMVYEYIEKIEIEVL